MKYTCKSAFTLIELLVVIAIIAILAAILFPVFAQAKIAAKKTVAISNIKQQGIGLLLYANNYDDTYPSMDGCVQNSSLNPKFRASAYNSAPFNGNDPAIGCTGNYWNRINNFSWQKWCQPYVKSTDVYFNPLRERDAQDWDTNGELSNQFLLNNGLTGSVDWKAAGTNPYLGPAQRGIRVPWNGGTTTAVPRPSEAMIIMEASYAIGVIPMMTDDSKWDQTTQRIIGYPLCYREYWRNKFNKTPRGSLDCYAGTVSTEVDTNKCVTGGITVGMVDGSAHFMRAGAFLAKCPSKTDMFLGGGVPANDWGAGYDYGGDCHGIPNDTYGKNSTVGNLGVATSYGGGFQTQNQWPLWGLGN